MLCTISRDEADSGGDLEGDSRTPLSRIELSRISRCPVRKSPIPEFPHTKTPPAVPESRCPGQIPMDFRHPGQRGATVEVNQPSNPLPNSTEVY